MKDRGCGVATALDARVHHLVALWEQAPAGRKPPLEELCAHALDLLPEVRRRIDVLAAVEPELDRGSGDTTVDEDPAAFRPPMSADAAGDLPLYPPEAPGERPPVVPGYRVVSKLGEGGMATVWRAVQLSTRRDVALKLMGRGGGHLRRWELRFEREVELAARLEHPNVARVYDSGIRDGGYYYAMELIEGRPLTAFVRSSQPGRSRVLQLAATVCDAVQYAHMRGIIHRDLKPSNILVTADGTPKVVDFGLAREIIDAPPAAAAAISLSGEISGTPAYMSPEQARGEADAVDTRTDVYSLGVILFELLTDRLPHPPAGPLFHVLKRIAEEDAPPPSSVRRDIDRDLDAVVLKALQRDPRLRYPSAAELAADIRRYLAGRTVTARHRTALYVALKWVRRHAIGVAVAAAVVAGAATAGTLYLRREHRAYLARLHQGIRQDVLRQQAAADRHLALHTVVDLDAPGQDLPADPARLAAQRAALGKATQRLLHLADGRAPTDPGDPDTAVALARVGAGLELAGRFADARDAYGEAAAIFARHAADDPDGGATRALMTTHLQLGRLHLRPPAADLAAARRHLSAAQQLLDALSARPGARAPVRPVDRWRLLGGLVDLRLREQNPAEALRLARAALTLAEKGTADAGGAFSRRNVLHSLKRLAQAHAASFDAGGDASHLAAAADALSRALAADRAAQARSDTLASRKELAVTLYELGAVRRRGGAHAEAEALLLESVRWMEPLATADAAGESARSHVSTALSELAAAADAGGRPQAAADYRRRAAEFRPPPGAGQ